MRGLSIRTWLALALGFLAGIFVIQNISIVDFRFLFWQSSMSLVILLGITLFTGTIIGLLLGLELFRSKKKKGKKSESAPEEPEA
jgi:uncharacterized integral membrane protein